MKGAGFTLIELMVTVLVLLVLSAVAYASLDGFVVRSRRIEAQVALLELMQEQERHYSRHNTYVAFSADSTDADARRFRWYAGASAAASAYELRGEECAGHPLSRCIVLSAVPGTQRVNAAFKDLECGTLSLDSAGRQGASGTGAKCWP